MTITAVAGITGNMDPGSVSTTPVCTGATNTLGDGCPATSALLTDIPAGVTLDAFDNIYITSFDEYVGRDGGHRVRKVTTWLLIPALSKSASQTIEGGTASIALSGTIAAGTVRPHDTETMTITINSVSMSVPIIGGSFAATFDTSTLPISVTPYAITYTYAGDDAIGSVSDSSTTLTVKAPLIPMTITANNQTMIYGSVMPPLTYTVNPSVTLDTAATCVPPATYPGAITCSGAAKDGYKITYVDGLLTVIPATPAFSNLTASQTIVYGTPTITLSGTIAAVGATPPSSETVTITINSVSTAAQIGANGSFSATIGTSSHLGCFVDSDDRALTTWTYSSWTNNSVEACSAACSQGGFKYAGVEDSNECWCGNNEDYGRLGTSSMCVSSCTGDSTEICGGPWALNIYKVASNLLPVSATPYAITYAYAGDGNFTSAADSSTTLTVMPAPPINGGQFGALPVGQTNTAGLTVTFVGSGTVSNMLATTQGVAGLDFRLTTGGSCATNASYNIGDTCTAYVTFSPSAAGLRLGALVLYDNASPPNVLASAALAGIGQASVIAFTPGLIATVAGNGILGNTGDGGAATSAKLYWPYGLVTDAAGNLSISLEGSGVVRQVAFDGTIVTVAGSGVAGYNGDGIPATTARLNYPEGLAMDGAGNLYIVDNGNQRVRKVTPFGTITTVAGNGNPGYNGDNIAGTSAELNIPRGVAVDGAGNLYIADGDNRRVRKLSADGTITTVAGGASSICGTATNAFGDGCPATGAKLGSVYSVAVDGSGIVYIADNGYNRIRKVSTDGTITTVAGGASELCSGATNDIGDGCPATSAILSGPISIALDQAGSLYILDLYHDRVRKVTPDGIITTVAGNGITGKTGDNGPATSAEFNNPQGIAVDAASNLYVADLNNNVVRKVDVADPPSLTFASTAVGQSSATQTVMIENHGNLPLAFTAITPANATLDSSVTTCSLSAAVPPGASCVLGVQFAPQMAGALVAGSVVLTDNAASSPQTITLSGPAAQAKQSTTVSVGSSLNPSVYGNSVQFTATVSWATGGPPTGTVSFMDGNASLGNGVLGTSGLATFVVSGSLSVGSHNISAVYEGDTSFAGSTSDVLVQMVNKGVLTVTADSAARATGASNPTLTYSITGFVSGDTSAVVSGTASLATTATTGSPVGAYPITFATQSLTATNYTFTYVNGTLVVFDTSSSQPLPMLLSPASATAGGAGFTLTVFGESFTPTSTVLWNGAVRATTYVSSTQLTAAISAADIAAEATNLVTVANLSPAFTSSAQPFAVISATPVAAIRAASISVASDGSGNHVLTLTGTDFVSGSTVQWNAAGLTTNYVSPWSISATITVAQYASLPTTPAAVAVVNPAGTSAAFEVP